MLLQTVRISEVGSPFDDSVARRPVIKRPSKNADAHPNAAKQHTTAPHLRQTTPSAIGSRFTKRPNKAKLFYRSQFTGKQILCARFF